MKTTWNWTTCLMMSYCAHGETVAAVVVSWPQLLVAPMSLLRLMIRYRVTGVDRRANVNDVCCCHRSIARCPADCRHGLDRYVCHGHGHGRRGHDHALVRVHVLSHDHISMMTSVLAVVVPVLLCLLSPLDRLSDHHPCISLPLRHLCSFQIQHTQIPKRK